MWNQNTSSNASLPEHAQSIPSILIADEGVLFRIGLRQALIEGLACCAIDEASTCFETLAKLHERNRELLVLNVNMPDQNGLELLRIVRATYPQTKVLMLSSFPERQFAASALRAGALGYVWKQRMLPEELLQAVKTVLAGGRYISRQLADVLESESNLKNGKSMHAQLSRRELQIFSKVAVGYSVSAIASELHLSVKTVSTYRTRLMSKMGFNNNAEVIAYALRSRIIPLEHLTK